MWQETLGCVLLEALYSGMLMRERVRLAVSAKESFRRIELAELLISVEWRCPSMADRTFNWAGMASTEMHNEASR